MSLRKKAWHLFVSAILMITLVVGYTFSMTTAVYAEDHAGTAAPEQELDSGSDILNLEKIEPEELSNYPDNVYDVDQNQPFLLSEQNELALLVGDNGTATMYHFDNFSMKMTAKESTDGSLVWVNGINVSNCKSYTKTDSNSDSNISGLSSVRSLQSIGFDKNGTGRREYIASVGYYQDAIKFYVQNTRDGSVYTRTLTINSADAFAAGNVLRDNYLSITAGDYDGDGKDTIIVYYNAVEGSVSRIIELYPSSATTWDYRTIMDMDEVVVNTKYKEDGHYRFKPVVSLATGDFNGDGKDQLAYSAGFYNTSPSVANGYQDYECDNLEQFATCVGIVDRTGAGWSKSAPIWMYDRSSNYTASGNTRTYPLTIMHAGIITAGDVNNDGLDEIVAAGYMSLDSDDNSTNCARAIYENNKLVKVSGVCNWSDRLVCSVISYSKSGYTRTSLQPFSMSMSQSYTFTNFCREEDWAFTKLAMCCGKTNGNNSPEDVFIGGIIYDFSDSSPSVKYSPNFIGANTLNKTSGGAKHDSSVNWVRNVTAGNFDGNNAGREQFVFTHWQKYKSAEQYSANVGVITGVEYQDKDSNGKTVGYGSTTTVASYGPPSYYACSLRASDTLNYNYPIHGDKKAASQLLVGANGANNGINTIPVAIDKDDDGVLGRFHQSGYVYTDPEVLAVLEAGPYFGEIDEAGGYIDPCETTYSISTGYGTGTSRSDNVSFEVGFTEEAELGPLKQSLEIGYTMDWSHSYESSYTATTTMDFKAAGEDIVCISRIPQLVYTYDIWDASNNTWIENGYNVRVPLGARYFTLSIEDYNAFVDEYNKLLGENGQGKLRKIIEGTDIPADHEGNPDNYWQKWSDAGNGYKQLSTGSSSLGYSGSSKGWTFSSESSSSESTEMSHGFHYNLTMMGGEGVEGVGGAWAGGYVNLDYSHSTGYSKTKIDASESGGSVQDISSNAVSGLKADAVKAGYKFSWTFGKWTRVLVDGGNEVPFYGYVVKDLVRRALPPDVSDQNHAVTEGYPSFTFKGSMPKFNSALTITKKSGDDKITYDSTSRAIRVDAGLPEGTYTAVFHISNGLTQPDGGALSYDREFSFNLRVAEDYTTNWTGNGTAADPYVITNTEGWGSLARMINAGIQTDDLFFKLGDDISISETIGTDEYPFSGYFDGNGYTLTMDIEKTSDADAGLAPFARIRDAEIAHLKTSGAVKGARHCSGLVGYAFGTNTILDCDVAADITTTDYCGGILGHSSDSSTRIEGCVFRGTITGNNANVGAIWGWGDSQTAEVVNCYECGKEYTGVKLNPIGLGNPTNGDGVSNTYYTNDPDGNPGRNWEKYGKKAYSILVSQGISIDLGESTYYEVSGISAYNTGLKYDGVIHAGSGDEFRFRFEGEVPSDKYVKATAGTLTGSGDEYTLTMTDEDAVLYLADRNIDIANHVLELIAAIPELEEITASDEDYFAIQDARNAYNDLTEEQKELVGNEARIRLENSERSYEIRQQENSDRESAEETDNEIRYQMSDIQTEIDQKIDDISHAIEDNNRGLVNSCLYDLKQLEESLNEISNRYVNLNIEEKGYSEVAADLIELEQRLGTAIALGEEFAMSDWEVEQYRDENNRIANEVIEIIDRIPDLTTVDLNDEIAAEDTRYAMTDARNAYQNLTAAQKALVMNVAKLVSAEKSYGALLVQAKIAALDPGSAEQIPQTDPVITIVYSVTFVDGQGKVLKTQVVEEGSAATPPADPTREGYTFEGWDKDFSNVTEDMTVTAMWKEKTTPPAPDKPVSIEKAKVVLSATGFTYNGKVRKPTIKTIGGKTLKSGTDYTAKWSNTSSKNVGTYTVTITGKGKYTGTTKATYKINPKGTSLGKLARGKKAVTVKWTKQSAKMAKNRITGYQIQLATDSKFTKNKKEVSVKGYSKTSQKVSKLLGGKKYYVRIRTYMTVSGKKCYSPWTKAKTVTTKK